MSMLGKYRVILAATPEHHQHHRQLTEQAMQRIAWPPMLRAELESELHHITDHETICETQRRVEKKKKKTGTGEGDETGDGSGGGEGNRHAAAHASIEAEEEAAADVEALALLLYQAEQAILPPSGHPIPLAAATMLFNKTKKSARMKMPIAPEEKPQTPPSTPSAVEMLPTFERYAAQIGINVMYVRVHPSAIGRFTRELGYEAVGPVVVENGLQVQAMRKKLDFHPALPTDVPT